MELRTLSAPPTNRAATSPACCASIGLDTEPVSITPIAQALGLNSRRRQHLFQRRAYAVEIALDRDVVGGELLAVGAKEYDVGLTDRRADNISAMRRANDGVCNLRIGDQHILDVIRQIDHDGFADAERQETHLG